MYNNADYQTVEKTICS